MTFKVDVISEGLRHVVDAFSEVIKLDESNNTVIINEPLNPKIAGAIKGCCKDYVANIDDIIADAYQIFTDTELCELNMYIQRNRGDILFARKWFLYEGQSEDVILPYFAQLLGKDFDEHGINGIMYRSNGSAGAFIKLAKVLNIQWVLLGDNDNQGESTTNEVLKCGYKQKDIADILQLTKAKDFEHELANIPSIFADYEYILGDKITGDIRKLKEDGNTEEYKENIVKLIQGGKVENAYNLLRIWGKRHFSTDEIPGVMKKLIEKV